MTVEEETKILEEIHKEIMKKDRLLYSYEIRGIIDKFIDKGRWIPVSERLPDKSGLYLISVDDLVTVANFTGTYFMRRGGYVEVDAWQALLEPYKPYKKGGVE